MKCSSAFLGGCGMPIIIVYVDNPAPRMDVWRRSKLEKVKMAIHEHEFDPEKHTIAPPVSKSTAAHYRLRLVERCKAEKERRDDAITSMG